MGFGWGTTGQPGIKLLGVYGQQYYPEVANYAALPTSGLSVGQIVIVKETTGTWLLGTRKRAGLYRLTSISPYTWELLPVTQAALELADFPSSYTGAATKAVTVKADETGLEFYDIVTALGTKVDKVAGSSLVADTEIAKIHSVGADIKNKGKVWISGGDNVITFGTAHGDADYIWNATLVQSAMGGITPRLSRHTMGMPVYTFNESTTRGRVRLNGGYGFTSCGANPTLLGTTERFDDVANTHTARTAISPVRYLVGGYTLNGYGFCVGGEDAGGNKVGTNERFDDIANAHTARTVLSTVRKALATYSLEGYGFTSCGQVTGDGNTGETNRFDDVSNAYTNRTAATARRAIKGYALNGYGFSTCGYISAVTGTTERYDNTADTHTARTSATARSGNATYSIGGLGYTSHGYISAESKIVEKFDDVANTHTARTDGTTTKNVTAGYSLNGYGFVSCGSPSGTYTGEVQRFDETANAHTTRTSATSRGYIGAYATNEYFINYATF